MSYSKSLMTDFGSLVNSIDRVFSDIEVAEEEIRRGQDMYPSEAKLIDSCFKLLLRPQAITNDDLYRAHVRELVERVANGGDTRKATRAEILAELADFASQVKPTKLGCLVMAHLMDLTLYSVEATHDIVQGLRESAGKPEYPEQIGDTVEELRDKLAVAERVLG